MTDRMSAEIWIGPENPTRRAALRTTDPAIRCQRARGQPVDWEGAESKQRTGRTGAGSKNRPVDPQRVGEALAGEQPYGQGLDQIRRSAGGQSCSDCVASSSLSGSLGGDRDFRGAAH
jgi:hypothetical protein